MNVLKKMLVFIGVSAVTLFVLAGSNDALLTFSTKGPDAYADGTPVQAGECYALVWVRTGFEFAGLDVDGRPVDPENNSVVAALPLAKAREDGSVRCPLTLFQIDETYARAHANGTFSLLLLDTRRQTKSGELLVTGDATQVNAWGYASKSRVKVIAGTFASGSAKGAYTGAAADGAVSSVSSEIPADENVPQPKITGIRVKDGFVTLTVKGTSPRLLYNLAAGAKPGELNHRHVAGAVGGHADRNREITIVTPVREGQNFFKVIRN